MKSLLYSIHRKACKLLLAAAVFLPVTSCDTVWDDDDDCPTEYRVKFEYDYNMLHADAFASQVHSVTLYAFDADGKLVLQQTEQGDALADPNYTMALDVNPGNYQLIAWAGLQDGDAFTVPQLTEGVSTLNELTCRINRYPYTLHGEQVDSKCRHSYDIACRTCRTDYCTFGKEYQYPSHHSPADSSRTC